MTDAWCHVLAMALRLRGREARRYRPAFSFVPGFDVFELLLVS
jgi:hypothetical protein